MNVKVFCNMCDATFTSIESFDEHWEETHAIYWGRNICKTPTVRIVEAKER